MKISNIVAASALAALVLATGSAVTAGDTTIKAISKSTQAVPPIPPGLTAIFGENIALFVGQIGVPGTVLGTVVIGGILYTIFSTSSSTTTT